MNTDQLKPKSSGKDADKALYRAFAHLSADWIWELDKDLCYVFHDSRIAPRTGLNDTDLVGRNRIEVIDQCLMPSAELAKHNELMRQHQKVDLVLPVSLTAKIKHVLVIAEPQFSNDGEFTGYRGCGRDVTDRVATEAELEHLASHDDLTGVVNRREFERRLSDLHERSVLNNEEYSLCFIDLDKFKHVNDCGGHHAGDQLLRELVGVISKQIHAGETLARLGGDEFGLLLLSDASTARHEVERIIDTISRHKLLWENKEFHVGASIGIAAITGDTESIEALMIKADTACYSAKNNGRNQSHIFDEASHVVSYGEKRVGMIKKALQNSQYKLLMQPIMRLSEPEKILRYELLVRLACDDGKLLEPAEFMPLAKQYSLMQELDFWVVENALLGLSSMHELGKDVALSINLSASSLTDNDALARIENIFDKHDFPKNRVCFDITETHAIRNVEAVAGFMKRLRSKGVEFALDDFGNGLCSFSYLQHFPLDYLKIDGELIRRMSTDETVRCIVGSLHDLGLKLGIKTVAESVEDDETIRRVKEIGFDYMQGFGVAKLIEFDVPVVLSPELCFTHS